MRLLPHEFNGFLFQQTTKVASDFLIPYDWRIGGIGTNNIPLSQNFPKYASKILDGDIKVINVNFNDIDVDRDVLVIAMDILGDGQHQLLANDELGRLWYLNAVCVGVNDEVTSDGTAKFGVVFEVDDPLWKLYMPSTQSISVNVTGSGTITPIGNQPALPIITITPIGSGDYGFSTSRFIQIINNNVPDAYNQGTLTHYPLNLTGAGLNTAALIADNSNKCLVNVGGGINVSVTTIPYDTVTGVMPSSGLLYIGTEQISYTGKTGTTSGNLTGCVRGVNGTTAATHADNSVIYHSKIKANGDDLRIYVDGAEVKRWFGGGGINTSTTYIWIDWNQPANSNMTLGAAIAGTGDVGTITIQNTAANIALMSIIPLSGNVLIGTEIFVYTGVDVGNLQLTGCTRASKQTSAGAHSVADVVYFVTHDVWMYYGNPSISAYVVDDTYKPIFNIASSTNTSWVYDEFRNTTNNGSTSNWVPTTPFPSAPESNSRYYTATQDTLANPATVMGGRIERIANGGPSAIYIYWSLYNPCGFTHITVTGKKYRDTAIWFGSLGSFSFRADSIAGAFQVWTESSPSVINTWEALSSHSSVSLSGTRPVLLLTWYDRDTSNVIHKNSVEWEAATLVVDSTRVPTINIAAEQTSFNLNSVLSNAANGDTMELNLVMQIGNVLTVNTKEKTITLADGTNQINALQNMPVRADWFPFLPAQANLISITDAGQVTFDFAWEDRSR
jgi:hypothetical protein